MLSKTQILLMVFMFALAYITLSSAAISYYYNTQAQNYGVEIKSILGIPYTYKVLTDFSPQGITYIEIEDMMNTQTIITLLNALILVPIGMLGAWIIASSLPTLNGGA